MIEKESQDNYLTLFKMMTSFWISQALNVFCKLGIADLMADKTMAVDDLARHTNTNSQALCRLLRALASEGILIEESVSRFSLSELGKSLKTNTDQSLSSAVLLYNAEAYKAWGNLLEVVSTGEPTWEKSFGWNYFQYLHNHPDSHAVFNKAMSQLGATLYKDQYIKEAYPIENNSLVIDIGGGIGGLLTCLLHERPDLTGILFDLPNVIAHAKKSISQSSEAKISFQEGNFFEEVPTNGAVYILKRILHDWPDQKAIDILKVCANAMNKNSRILVIEFLVPPPNQPSPAHFMDLHMMTLLGGIERRELDFARLFDAAGLNLIRAIPSKGLLAIIEGRLR